MRIFGKQKPFISLFCIHFSYFFFLIDYDQFLIYLIFFKYRLSLKDMTEEEGLVLFAIAYI